MGKRKTLLTLPLAPIIPSSSIISARLSLVMASDTRAPTNSKGKVREKIALKPGFHLADWKRLCDVMTKPTQQIISPEELAKHNTQFDSWTAYKGKVYNISNYLPYHPGGEEILRQAAGKDCTDLFIKYHRWINIDSILGKVCIGTLAAPIQKISEEEDDEEEQERGGEDRAAATISEDLKEMKVDSTNEVIEDQRKEEK